MTADRKRWYTEGCDLSRSEPDAEEILKYLGEVNVMEKGFVTPHGIDKVIIRTKGGEEYEGVVTRTEYVPGPFGAPGHSELTVANIQPERTGQYGIKKVIFNNPATIVFWDDGTRTVVCCRDNMKKITKMVDGKVAEAARPQKADTYSEATGLAMALVKKHYGNSGRYNEIFRKYIPGMEEREKAERTAAKKAKRAKRKEAEPYD